MFFRRYSDHFQGLVFWFISCHFLYCCSQIQPTHNISGVASSNRLLSSGSASRSLVAREAPDKVGDPVRRNANILPPRIFPYVQMNTASLYTTSVHFRIQAFVNRAIITKSSSTPLQPFNIWSAITPFIPLIQLTHPTLNKVHLRLSLRFLPQRHIRCARFNHKRRFFD